ncbi:MAG: CoA ester lyase [Polaromonas sp.]|jgi:citrate lyase subunit beta/citryl-CoA lyase|nr:CoA ester lyase [Polaromonas sp.]
MSNHFDAFARSYLFVPGSRPDRISKALESGAHAVIVDLEDAVAPEDKIDARQQVETWLENNPARQILLRINAVGTRWHYDDLRVATAPNVAAVVLPKAENAQNLALIAEKPVLPIIESALGFVQLDAIAAHPATRRLIFGTYDFRADLGLGSSDEALLYFASKLVLVSRVAGLTPPVDGVMAKLSNDSGWLREAQRARDLGFGGKLCIHPRQVGAVNAGFAPSEDEIRWAKKMIAGAGERATAVIDGEFVDRPVLLRAKAIIQQTEQLGCLR